MSYDEPDYGTPVHVLGGEDEPLAYYARFWRNHPRDPEHVWLVVYTPGGSPFPRLALRNRVAVCPEPDGLEEMPAWAWRDAADSRRLEDNLQRMIDAVRGQPWSAL